MGVHLEKQIPILSNLNKYKMSATKNEPGVIIQLTSASNWPIKESSLSRSFIHCYQNVKLYHVYQHLLSFMSYCSNYLVKA